MSGTGKTDFRQQKEADERKKGTMYQTVTKPRPKSGTARCFEFRGIAFLFLEKAAVVVRHSFGYPA
jgi:hypothetical protein